MAAEVDVRESKAPERRSYKKIHHLVIEKVKGENGGHIVRNHYQSAGMEYHEPSTHIFAKGEGQEMLNHVAKHMGVSTGEPEEEEQEE